MTAPNREALLWTPAPGRFEPDGFDAFLVAAARAGASDVSLQTGSPAWVEIDGQLRRASAAPVDRVSLQRIGTHLFNDTAEGILRSGRAIDCSRAVQPDDGPALRLRCNLAPVQVAGGFGVNITLRILPGAPPGLDSLAMEPEVARALTACRGLTLVTGVPGSGKSTLLAAATRRLLESGAGRIQSFEAPIEFVFDEIAAEGALMSSAEIPRHFETFADGLRSSLRRRPAAVIVGEARDRETVEAVVRAADFGIAVYATAHTVGVAATVRRLVAEFPAGERAERGAALIDTLNLVVTQVLLPRPGGGRIALREWLVFEPALKAELFALPQERWPDRIQHELAATGRTLAAAGREAFARGRIDEAACRRLRAGGGDAP